VTLLLLLLIIPFFAGLGLFLVRSAGLRRLVLLVTAAFHLVLSLYLSIPDSNPARGAWIGVDSLSAIFLVLTSVLFLAIGFYSIGYMREHSAPDHGLHEPRRIDPEALFMGCLLVMLSAMSLAIVARQFALQWVAIEATTLASTPLVYYHKSRKSLEAAWKYLIICSVGIVLALIGIFFLRMTLPVKFHSDLTIDALLQNASTLNTKWLKTAFIFMLVGYGTKMGIAPFHTWLPDAHSEAPAPVSALLSGALLNCALIGILRMQQVSAAAGIGDFGAELLVIFGVFSIVIGAIFILRQPDFKRMLAYSSVENMGIIALGVGIGGGGVFGSLFHAVNHSLTKVMLFFAAGSILSRFATKDSSRVQGVIRTMPWTGGLWIAGFLAITGAPPFGTFLSEFAILRAALDKGHYFTAALFMFLLFIIFVGMSAIMLGMVFGARTVERRSESLLSVVPPLTLGVALLVLGLYMPDVLQAKLGSAAMLLEGVAR